MVRSKQASPRALAISTVAAFVAAALVGKAQAGTLAVGPVEQVNLKSSTLVVLGQTYHLNSSVVLKNQSGAPISLTSLTPDTLVSIEGAETATGQATVKDVTSLSELNVPGATHLQVTSVVSSETPTGSIKVGNLTVDINSTLTSDTQNFSVGSLVEITGTQPNPGGIFLAQSIVPVNSVPAGSASSFGIQGGGSSSFGIQGGGHSSVKTLGIQGGGASSFGIQGGGHSSVKTLGIQGGGASSFGIQGGGHSSVKTLGIQGGGASSFGIQGGGNK